MAWRVVPTPEFARELRALDPQMARRITATLNEVVSTGDPRTRGKALHGNLGDYWRYRVGDWRVMCELRDEELVVLAIRVGHRSTVYHH